MSCLSTTHELHELRRSESVGISREHRGLPDVVESQVKHSDSLQTNTTPTVRRSTIGEGLNIAFYGGHVQTARFCSLRQKVWVVNTLSSTGNLFTSHEEVV